MNNIIKIFLIFIFCNCSAQNKKNEYLKNNRFNLREQNNVFDSINFSIIGFGAYHGSSKTYDTELLLIESLLNNKSIDFYIPEINFSQAYFFKKYLEDGNEDLLKELIFSFQTLVTQEGTIDHFNFWKNLRFLYNSNIDNKIDVIGIDIINDYRFPLKHIFELSDSIKNWKTRDYLNEFLYNDSIDLSISNKDLTEPISKFIEDYNNNSYIYNKNINDTIIFKHIIKNISYNFDKNRDREEIMTSNYIYLHNLYDLSSKKQFFKYGFFHIKKDTNSSYPPFFSRLISRKIYEKDKIITIAGYLTQSKVLWDKIYDNNGNYKSYTTKRGYGIGDYWKEYFKGISYLKKNKISDITLFKLNDINSPYNNGLDLIQINYFFKNNHLFDKSKSTIDYIDYAILISDSSNQIPLEEY